MAGRSYLSVFPPRGRLVSPASRGRSSTCQQAAHITDAQVCRGHIKALQRETKVSSLRRPPEHFDTSWKRAPSRLGIVAHSRSRASDASRNAKSSRSLARSYAGSSSNAIAPGESGELSGGLEGASREVVPTPSRRCGPSPRSTGRLSAGGASGCSRGPRVGTYTSRSASAASSVRIHRRILSTAATRGNGG